MSHLLTEADSKRVADVLIQKIYDADLAIAGDIAREVGRIVHPYGYKIDWLPSMVEDCLIKISDSIAFAAEKHGDRS